MLLRHTTAEIAERTALTVNPAKTCQPIGAMYAALGIHNCLPHSHGSQGCCSYHRSTLTRHYKEPVMAATSSFTEGSSVFGGQANLLQAITTIFSVYNPDVIAVHTTCLSETIGDDIPQIIAKARDEGKIPAGKRVIHANTPSYVGSHVTGFANMVKGMATYFAEPAEKKTKMLNLIPGWVEPSDMREIKRLLAVSSVSNPEGTQQGKGTDAIVFPDTSDVLDAPQTGKHVFYPKGGTTVEQLQKISASQATVALGPSASEPAARELDASFKVPYETLELPIGLRATDRFVNSLRKLTRHRSRFGPRRARPADGHDHRHAPVLLPQARRPVGRSRPTGVAGRVPRRPRHAAGVHRHRHARQGSSRGGSRPRWRAACPRPRSAKAPRPTCSSCTNGSRTSRSIC